MRKEKVDVLIIGAGPAGSVSAGIIQKSGLKVMVVEKMRFPRFVIGESLLPRTMEALEDAGLLDKIKSMNFQEKFGAKFVRGDEVCDYNFSDQHTKGWNWTWQVPRADFDLALIEEVQKKGTHVFFESEVIDIKFFPDHSITIIQSAEGITEIEAKFIIDASGYGRVIPKMFHLDKPSSIKTRKTIFNHFKDELRNEFEEANRITIIVHKPEVWIWVIPFSNGNTSVGFVGNTEFFDMFEGTNKDILKEIIALEPYIARRFENFDIQMETQSIEGWSVTIDKFYGDGFVLVGNVTEFLDPVFSSGVTLAVSSAQRAAHLVVDKLNGREVNWEKEYQKPTEYGVNAFRTYVEGWYDGTLHTIFFAKNQNQEIKNQICSVLAGYVWDESNPFINDHYSKVTNLAMAIKILEKA